MSEHELEEARIDWDDALYELDQWWRTRAEKTEKQLAELRRRVLALGNVTDLLAAVTELWEDVRKGKL